MLCVKKLQRRQMVMNKSIPVLAIDGPSGSGKGTLAARMAAELGWHLLDSGALYRIVAAIAVRRGLDVEQEQTMCELAQSLDIAFPDGRVRVHELDLTDEIRTEDIGVMASRVAALPAVRVLGPRSARRACTVRRARGAARRAGEARRAGPPANWRELASI